MKTIVEFFALEHRSCDDIFTTAEAAAQSGDRAACQSHFAAFCAATECHFRQEEEVLFPAFEQAMGNPMGPTRVMRIEHVQMRDTLEALKEALAEGNLEAFLGHGETLMILMQQHNMKEEQILYPMCDRMLGAEQVAAIQSTCAGYTV